MKTQIITLKITVSDDYDYPDNWNWISMLDLGNNEEVEVLDCKTMVEGVLS